MDLLIKLQQDFNSALDRLGEVLSIEINDIVRDSAIKRFEICFDLAWKLIKTYAKKEGVECNSPRSCFRTAFELGLIDYNENWLKMVDDRNLTVHIYKEEIAEKVYPKLNNYLNIFKKLATSISEKINT